MRIDHATAFLFALKPRGIRFGLESTRHVLKNLKMPQNKFDSIHLAGSNGKGSTSAFLDSVLREAGYKVGLYTSPHLVHYRERFQINGRPVDDALIETAMDRLLEDGLKLDPEEVQEWIEHKDVVAKMNAGSWYQQRGGASSFCPLTFFECTTILAMMLFAQAGVDLAVMECGMGGRLDATNVLVPKVSVITPIHLEHTMWLGDTIRAIAGEKAGIIKPGIPVVCGRQSQDALEVIRAQAELLQAPISVLGEDFEASGSSKDVHFRIGRKEFGPVRLGLAGKHQIDNAAVASACLPFLEPHGWKASRTSVENGLSKVHWPGRFERFGRNGEWILDGAHNPDGMRVLVETLKEIIEDQKVRLVFGVLEDKQVDKMLPLILPYSNLVNLVRPKDARGKDPLALTPLFSSPPRVFQSVESALDALKIESGSPVLVTGSLTVIGEARDWLLRQGFSPGIIR